MVYWRPSILSSTKSSLLPRVSLMCIGAGEVDDPGPGGGAWVAGPGWRGPGGGAWVAVAFNGIQAELY